MLALTASSLDFGNVVVGATSAAQTITVSNAGGGTLTLSSLSGGTGTGRTAEFLRTGTCANGTSLTSTQSCTIVYQFRPAQTGARVATLGLTTNAGNANVSLAGTGVVGGQAPVLTPSATHAGLRECEHRQQQRDADDHADQYRRRHADADLAHPLAAPIPGDFPRTGTCANGSNLAAAQSCTVIYQFTPTLAGARAASLAVVSNGGNATLNVGGHRRCGRHRTCPHAQWHRAGLWQRQSRQQ